jgi:hypothetical protein
MHFIPAPPGIKTFIIIIMIIIIKGGWGGKFEFLGQD